MRLTSEVLGIYFDPSELDDKVFQRVPETCPAPRDTSQQVT